MPEMPEWVHVWWWLRTMRDPIVQEPLPQQRGHVDDALVMTSERYDELRGEWIEAGAPRNAKSLLESLRNDSLQQIEVPF